MSSENNNTDENKNNIQNEIQEDDKKNEEKENKNEVKDNSNSKPKENINIKDLPFYEYFQKTVQSEIQLGLMNVSKLKPSDPIKYLGEFLLEKSKSYKP